MIKITVTLHIKNNQLRRIVTLEQIKTIIVGLTHSHCPVDAQVQRDQDDVVEEKVDSLCPALYCSVSSRLPASSTPQFGEEEGAKRVDF